MPSELWNSILIAKKLYGRMLEPVCRQYVLTRMELDILLFLANNPGYDTAADMVERRQLAKSQVSSSVAQLEADGYLKKTYFPGNRKTVHLKLLPRAQQVIEQGRQAQLHFFKAVFTGFSQDEKERLEASLIQISENIQKALREEPSCCSN